MYFVNGPVCSNMDPNDGSMEKSAAASPSPLQTTRHRTQTDDCVFSFLLQ